MVGCKIVFIKNFFSFFKKFNFTKGTSVGFCLWLPWVETQGYKMIRSYGTLIHLTLKLNFQLQTLKQVSCKRPVL
jgi:hypothetical protein